MLLEAMARIELARKSFADSRLTTCLHGHLIRYECYLTKIFEYLQVIGGDGLYAVYFFLHDQYQS